MLFLFLLLSINCNFLCKGKLVHYPVLMYLKPGQTLTDWQVPFRKILIESYGGIYSRLTYNDFEYVQLMFKEYTDNLSEFLDVTQPIYVLWFDTKRTKNNAEKIKNNLKKDGYILIGNKKKYYGDTPIDLYFYKIGNYNALLAVANTKISLLIQLDCFGEEESIEKYFFDGETEEYIEPERIFNLSY